MFQSTDIVSLNLVMERELLGFFLTVCLPTVIVNIVGHLTVYFQVQACFIKSSF